jgi:dCMP deaminase
MRISWEEHAMGLAEKASLRSEDPYQKVGACVLDFNKDVLAVAYNGLVSGLNVSEDFWKDRDKRRPYMIHAETNALARIKRGEGFLIACTLLPCSSCAANIAAHGIKKVLFKEIYHRDTSALDIFKFYGISCNQL